MKHTIHIVIVTILLLTISACSGLLPSQSSSTGEVTSVKKDNLVEELAEAIKDAFD